MFVDTTRRRSLAAVLPVTSMTVCVDGGITNATDSDDAPFPILASLALPTIVALDRKRGVGSEAVLDRRRIRLRHSILL